MKKLEKYFDQQYELALKNLRLAQQVLSEKTVHELRVSIKRIKALCGFAGELLPDTVEEVKRHFKPFKRIFQAAGTLRDAQVQASLLQKCAKTWNLPAPESYLLDLQNRQEDAFRALQKTARKTDLEQAEMKPLLKLLRKASGEELAYQTEKILRARFTQVRALIQDTSHDEPMHEARKVVKSVYYILHLVFKPQSPQQYQDLKRLEETIGDWHDLAVLLDNLRAHLTSPTEAEHAFVQQMENEKQRLQAQIPDLVRQELRCWKILGHLKWS